MDSRNNALRFGNHAAKTQVSGPSSLCKTVSVGKRPSMDIPTLSPKNCTTPSTSDAGSQDHQRSSISVHAMDIHGSKPTRSTSNDALPLADLASFSMKVKEKRYEGSSRHNSLKIGFNTNST